MTVYIEPWHADILTFLDMKRNRGSETSKARRLFYALWVPDLLCVLTQYTFIHTAYKHNISMKRVEDDGLWTLFDPVDVPELLNNHGDLFERLYQRYEKSDLKKQSLGARTLWKEILESQIETGGPFIMYKDAANGTQINGSVQSY